VLDGRRTGFRNLPLAQRLAEGGLHTAIVRLVLGATPTVARDLQFGAKRFDDGRILCAAAPADAGACGRGTRSNEQRYGDDRDQAAVTWNRDRPAQHRIIVVLGLGHSYLPSPTLRHANSGGLVVRDWINYSID
jgi:hypothetical protein